VDTRRLSSRERGLLCQGSDPARQTLGFVRQTYGFVRQTYGFVRQTYDLVRQTYGFVCQTYGFVRQTYGFVRQTYGFVRQTYGFDLKKRVFAFFRQKPVKSVISSRCQSSLNQARVQVRWEASP
jgi:hypothetical protein